MKILALDTSTELCSVALWNDGPASERDALVGQGHSEHLFPMIAAVLAEAGAGFGHLDAIAFGAGPGSFTGLRIACGVAQGIGFAAGLPLLPIGTLAALAHGTPGAAIVAALDARMGEIYLGAYRRRGQEVEETLAPGVWHPQHLPDLPPGRYVGVGSGFAAYAEDFVMRYGVAIESTSPGSLPHARHVAALAAVRLPVTGGMAAQAAGPLYVRDKVAMTVAERKALKR